MALIFAKRMKNALNEIIDETQCGFMKGRHISSNIRLVIDLVQYSNLLNGDPLILCKGIFLLGSNQTVKIRFRCMHHMFSHS